MFSHETRKRGSLQKVASAPGKITCQRKDPSQATLATALRKVSAQNVETPQKEQALSNELFEKLSSCSKRIPLPGEMWVSYVVCGSHILFAKVEPDLQLSFKLVIYPDVSKISYYGKVLSWLKPNIKSESDLIDVLQFLHVLKLPKFVP